MILCRSVIEMGGGKGVTVLCEVWQCVQTVINQKDNKWKLKIVMSQAGIIGVCQMHVLWLTSINDEIIMAHMFLSWITLLVSVKFESRESRITLSHWALSMKFMVQGHWFVFHHASGLIIVIIISCLDFHESLMLSLDILPHPFLYMFDWQEKTNYSI